jgi:hypothetical protein
VLLVAKRSKETASIALGARGTQGGTPLSGCGCSRAAVGASMSME